MSENKVKISEFLACFVSVYFLRTGTIWLLFTGNIPQEIVGNGADSDMRRYFLEKIKLLLDTEEQNPYSVFQIWCVTDKQALTSHKCYYFYLTFMGVGVFFCCPLKRLPLQNVERKGERT